MTIIVKVTLFLFFFGGMLYFASKNASIFFRLTCYFLANTVALVT